MDYTTVSFAIQNKETLDKLLALLPANKCTTCDVEYSTKYKNLQCEVNKDGYRVEMEIMTKLTNDDIYHSIDALTIWELWDIMESNDIDSYKTLRQLPMPANSFKTREKREMPKDWQNNDHIPLYPPKIMPWWHR